MSPIETNYSRTDLVNGLKMTGLRPGDIVFFQVSHFTLGAVECGSSERVVSELLLFGDAGGDRTGRHDAAADVLLFVL